MQQFLSFLQEHAALNRTFLDGITAAAERTEQRKNSYLYIENQSFYHLYFLLSGFASGMETQNGADVLTVFWEPMAFIVPHSIHHKTHFESLSTVQIREKSTLIKLRLEDIHSILDYPEGKNLYTYFVNQELRKHHQYQRFLRQCSVKNRIKHLIEKHPIVLRHFNQEQLASYVGTSRPNFSNLLAEINRQS